MLFGHGTFRIRCGDEMLVLDVKVLQSWKSRFYAGRDEFDQATWREIISDVTLPVWEKVFCPEKEIESLEFDLLATADGVGYCAAVSTPYTSRADDSRSEPQVLIHSLWKQKC